jgi:hypothetical protein
VVVTVRFGSAPTMRAAAQVNRLLARLRPVDLRGVGKRFTRSRVLRLGVGRATTSFSLHEQAGVILLSRIRAPRGTKAYFDARIPKLAGAGASTMNTSDCHNRGRSVVCTQPEEWCPLPQALWRVRLVKLSAPAVVIRVDFFVGDPPATR